MQGARHGFINGKQDVKAAEKHSVECIVLLTLWFIILSCLGCCNKRPSHNILFNRSIVHTIRLHVSEVRSPAWLAFTLCVPRPSADSAVCVQAQNRRCSKINLCICTPVYKFNIDELLLKLLAKGGSLTYFMSEADLGFFRSRGHNGATIYREGPSLPFKSLETLTITA